MSRQSERYFAQKLGASVVRPLIFLKPVVGGTQAQMIASRPTQDNSSDKKNHKKVKNVKNSVDRSSINQRIYRFLEHSPSDTSPNLIGQILDQRLRIFISVDFIKSSNS